MSASNSVRRARPLLGTVVEISAEGLPREDLGRAVEAAFQAVAETHRLMSFHDAESDVSRLNRLAAGHPVVVHPWTYEVLRIAQAMHAASDGAFDITVAPVLQKLGVLPADDAEAASARDAIAFRAVELLPGDRVRFRDSRVRIDLGGIAKGFAVDRAAAALRANEVTCGLVNAGGDLASFGPRPRRIHVRDPRHPGISLCRLDLTDAALASSGRLIDPPQGADAVLTAVIDPRSCAPAASIAGATVRAETCVIADALTKLVMIGGLDSREALEHYRASALFVSGAGELFATPDWRHEIGLAA